MRRGLQLGVVLLVPAALTTASSPAADVERQPVPWQLLGVGPDLRLVNVAYETGGCWRGDPQVTVTRMVSGIRINIYRERVVPAGTPCTDEVRRGSLTIPLRRRVAGRAISGGPPLRSDGTVPSRVPGVLDLRPADARRALEFQGFRVRELGKPHAPVSFQSPLPEKRVDATNVRLTLGRGLFRSRRLDRCVERGGIPSRVRVPEPGDADAPDLVLWLRHASAMASVGLYADRARARELAPGIRRTVRRIRGVFERRRHVTIAWYAPPAPALAEHVRRCVHGPLGRRSTP